MSLSVISGINLKDLFQSADLLWTAEPDIILEQQLKQRHKLLDTDIQNSGKHLHSP